jgi:hypothetical protein
VYEAMARSVFPTRLMAVVSWGVRGPPLSSHTIRYPLSKVNRYAMVPWVMISGSNEPRDTTAIVAADSSGVQGSSAAM